MAFPKCFISHPGWWLLGGGSITAYYYLVRSRDNQLWLKGWSTLNANIGWQQRWEMPCGIIGNASRYESNGILDRCYVCNYICTSCSSNKYSFHIGVKSDSTPSKPRHEKGTETPGWPVFWNCKSMKSRVDFCWKSSFYPGKLLRFLLTYHQIVPFVRKAKLPPWKKHPSLLALASYSLLHLVKLKETIRAPMNQNEILS